MDKVLQDKVDLWLSQDRNKTTRAEIESLVNDKNYAELTARLSHRIQFGTAGLRARMQAGFNSMNDLVVLQATQGLARYALATQPAPGGGGRPKVVVGHDHRHNSDRFAKLAARVFGREGFEVLLLDGLVHTPMVPFTAKRVEAALGLMITASHNPAADNGYKVYWSNAVQIIPPHDHGIAKQIEDSLDVADEAWEPYEQTWSRTEEFKNEYTDMVKALVQDPASNTSTPLKFAYTAMHGVGLPFAQRAFAAAGFPSDSLTIVQVQAQPDPDFPSVKFPNPEEKGALNLAIQHANEAGASIVLANDPDADRFCAAEKQQSGEWLVFTGDQLGTLFADFAIARYRESGRAMEELAVVGSTVSSKMPLTMAKVEGGVSEDCLTGFKWIGNKALELEAAGKVVVFGWEEAIGYMHGTEIRDKDGVSALVMLASLATQLAAVGKTLADHLDSLYFKYGFHATSNSYVVSSDALKTDEIFYRLRYGGKEESEVARDPKGALSLPGSLAGYPITYLRDLTVGYDSSTKDGEPRLAVDPSSHMISFAVGGEDGIRVTGTVRTSGTEPKIKWYCEGAGQDRAAVQAKLAKVVVALGTDWLRADEYGLERA